ncbi:peptidase [Methylomonas paludis]|uniref:Peptidase n=1 Tax=Methylomonas paludis TaxID=1173101 RepID=A0A975ML15_9GAMM|nr:peptidase [Methylomonas paludis]QWF69833.1 peptidase [Methylomonas paludis]
MTYCVALKLNAGMVFASDSRTNAGIDQISSFKKMRTFVNAGDRAIVILSSGNLSITQNAVNRLEHYGRNPAVRNVWNAESLFDVAQLLGECLREVREHDGQFLQQSNVDCNANFIVGGQIQNERQRLFLVYSEGNFIEASDETPYFQTGETKYGKPIIDRVIKPDTALIDAVKCILVSFDSTMRSNLSVGLPIDLACYKHSSFCLDLQQHITQDDPYFSQISRRWSEGLRGVFASLPNPDWLTEIHDSDPIPPS